MPRECTKFNPRRRKLFLEMLKAGYSVCLAAEKSHISLRNVYRLREKNAAFRQSWREAVDFCVEMAESELRRRGVDGVDSPVFYKGQQIATVKEYSDNLLLAYLRANRPEKYRERSEVRHDGELRTMVVLEGRSLPADIATDEIEDRG